MSALPTETVESREDFLARQPTYWLKRVYQDVRRRVEAELRPLGITLSQRDALLAVRHQGPMSVGDLSDALGLEQSSVSRLVLGLTRRGLLDLREQESDRRSRLVSVTPKGTEVLAATPGASGVAGTVLTEALTATEMDHFLGLLRKAAEALEKSER